MNTNRVLDDFKVTNFALAKNPEAQSSGVGSTFEKLEDRVILTIGAEPSGGSTFARLKYRLIEPYQLGDDFEAWEVIELPEDFYELQNGMMRLIGLWNNPENGRLAFWIDSAGCPRLQTEDKSKKLASTWLWRGTPGQYPVGKHKLTMRVVLGSLTEIFVDDKLFASVSGDNMPYVGYVANQIIYGPDGANSNTSTISMTIYEIGAKPYASPDLCHKLELDYLASEIGVTNAAIARDEAYLEYVAASDNFVAASKKRDEALAAFEKCKGGE